MLSHLECRSGRDRHREREGESMWGRLRSLASRSGEPRVVLTWSNHTPIKPVDFAKDRFLQPTPGFPCVSEWPKAALVW